MPSKYVKKKSKSHQRGAAARWSTAAGAQTRAHARSTARLRHVYVKGVRGTFPRVSTFLV